MGLKSPELQECAIFACYKINFFSQNVWYPPTPHYSLVNRTILPKDCQRCISATLRKMWNKLMSWEAQRERKKKDITYDLFIIPNWHTVDKTIQPAQLC